MDNRNACQFQNRLDVVAIEEEPERGSKNQITASPGPSLLQSGLDVASPACAAGQRRKMSLDIPFYRTGHLVTYPASLDY
jgi:hypothetical protein